MRVKNETRVSVSVAVAISRPEISTDRQRKRTSRRDEGQKGQTDIKAAL